MRRGSWLFPDGVDRERMLEMDQQLQPVRRACFVVLALALLASGPWLGWWTLVPLGLAGVLFRLAEQRIDRLKRPEYALFAAWACSQLMIVASVAMTGGAVAPMLCWLAVPMMTLGARFSERGIAAGLAFSLVLLVGVTLAADAEAVFQNPPLLFGPLALMVCVAIFQSVLMRSDIKHRAAAVIDPLTGMLNRQALTQRVTEFEQQARVTGQSVGLIVADIDHFKRVNDSHGHAAGDAVLKDVAYRLRKRAAHVRPLLPDRRRGVRGAASGRAARGRGRRGRGSAGGDRGRAPRRPRGHHELRCVRVGRDGFDYNALRGRRRRPVRGQAHRPRPRVSAAVGRADPRLAHSRQTNSLPERGASPRATISNMPIIPRSEWGTMWQWNSDRAGEVREHSCGR